MEYSPLEQFPTSKRSEARLGQSQRALRAMNLADGHLRELRTQPTLPTCFAGFGGMCVSTALWKFGDLVEGAVADVAYEALGCLGAEVVDYSSSGVEVE